MIAIVIQARMGSTRLRGKVLRPIAGRALLSYQIERLRRCTRADHLVVATSVEAPDDAILDFCKREAVAVVRGPEHDVLARFALAAQVAGATEVVRITADCPLIDPALVDLAIETFGSGRWDYLSNMRPPSWPYGMAVEVLTRAALDEANAEARDPAEREHVTPFLYWRPDRYRLGSLTRHPDLSAHRWTVDTPEDFELVSRILTTLYPVKTAFDIDDVLQLMDRHPDWSAINRLIEQQTVAPFLTDSP